MRRVKTAPAAKHNFDVLAMGRALQEREEKQKCERDDAINPRPCESTVTSPAFAGNAPEANGGM